ncbi:MAG TPA: OadG family protein [Nitrospinota bacterium]|jgi:Na+-transporting methylmalonyl-CoA/oxaloacetate decarboxylase gamma subunit|nr:OadG family protein [Nitrospinota bacterium]|tara:strand:+ start:85379 stop:85606 length:228 start_codon:yes stop_codon:yes gene_type:complete
MEWLVNSLIVTLIGMGVIFIVLGVLYLTILGLEKTFANTKHSTPDLLEDDPEIIAVVKAAIAMYRKQRQKLSKRK